MGSPEVVPDVGDLEVVSQDGAHAGQLVQGAALDAAAGTQHVGQLHGIWREQGGRRRGRH